ncbi:BMP family protein [Hespellia stercorisuis]|uniref:Basic membrane protein A n=1 Tax=Hespellia stercorisuis DSM 15480 TaxID=1121950 RepID=A0A1M6VD93_9FIRM|nr:BMP family protein [Hespellia stercorisuis]SHK79419.1 basic membrane protein A [Hespellia stercorisuis DSM 15480]
MILAITTGIVIAAMTACGSTSSTSSSGSSTTASSSSANEAADLKVAAVLGGPITDQAWNETQYDGLCDIESQGAETSYMENVSVTDAPDVIRTYASDGYDIVYIGSSSFKDATVEVAAEFPDTTFLMMNGGVTEGNMVSLDTADCQQGFIQGFICAMVTGTDTVGWVGGLEIAPTLNCEAGFKQGVAYANKTFGTDIKAVTSLTGSYTDIEAAKETTLAMIQNGSGAISGMADDATHGILAAAEEKSIPCVGTGVDQDELAPTQLITGISVDNEIVYKESFSKYLDGSVKDPGYLYGISAGVVYMADYSKGASILTDDQKTAIDDIVSGIDDGSIKVVNAADYTD